MKIRWWWILFLIPVVAGLARLHFDTEVLDLLPANVPAVQGLKIYQQHFSNSRELIVTVKASDAETAEATAKSLAEKLRAETNLTSQVIWQPPWQEHPEQTAELIGYLWLNQPPKFFQKFADKLSETNLPNVLAMTRERLATSMSPNEIGQLSYDPLGFTQLPQNSAAPNFAQGQGLFSSADGTFRIIFVEAKNDLADYRDCTTWLAAVKNAVNVAVPPNSQIQIGYTGRPVFVAEISGGMKHDITFSIAGTSFIIAILFWLAHRRIKPMLWLLTLLALILATTLALGGLIFGAISIVSMGFAAILLGLAVDYAVVHYQEALAHPQKSIPEIRRAIAPAIFWAAITTISAFLVLNFGGLPGLAQLGSLVAIGVALAALVMIFFYLPPLFPDRMRPQSNCNTDKIEKIAVLNPLRAKTVFLITAALIFICAAILYSGLPKMDATANVVQPRNSEAYATMDAIKKNLGHAREPFWLVIAGKNENEVAKKLDAIQPVLQNSVSNQTLAGFDSPDFMWPRPEFQNANRIVAQKIISEREALRAAILTNGFAGSALGLTESILQTWQRASAATNVFWPTNQLCDWIFGKISARETNQMFAVAFLYPTANATAISFAQLELQLPRDGVWLSSWELLGTNVLDEVKRNLWKLLLPMMTLILLSLWFAFRRFAEIAFSLGILFLSGLCLLAVMRLSGWQWNLLNLMALPLILGTGVDYSIFMQLALRRYDGDLRLAHRAVGRALLLCGGTAIAGFGSLGFSNNAGMASLGKVCAVGIAGNVFISVFLLPVWWKFFLRNEKSKSPSRLYAGKVWKMALTFARILPKPILHIFAKCAAAIYCRFASNRREIVVQNLLPVFRGDRKLAEKSVCKLFGQFALKICDLLRFESGVADKNWFTGWKGWEHFNTAHARGKGVLLVTPHLGNWELGGPFLTEHGFKLLVLTQPEPDAQLTALRQNSRAQRGVETLVVGDHDAFAFVEIIKRLQNGAIVALLVDRPPPHTAVNVKLFGKDFPASIAAAELARASGCAILPCIMVRNGAHYRAEIFPEINYDRAAIGSREGRIQLTQKMMTAFEPLIRENAEQWYHFVPVWPEEKSP